MIQGKVVGEVWATRKAPSLDQHKLLLVAQRDGTVLVALDTLDAGQGDEVLCSRGSGGRNVLQAGPDNRDLLCDAAVSLVVEGQSAADKGAR